MKQIIVLKFGGSSLKNQKLRLRAAQEVKSVFEQNFFPVVVVSAIGRNGDPYATDSLLKFAETEFASLDSLAKDLLLSCGEIISAVTFSQTLKQVKINAIPVTGWQAGIQTNGDFGNAKVEKVYIKNILDVIQAGKVPVVCGFQGINKNGAITTLGRGGSDTTASVLGNALNANEIRIYTDVDGVQTTDPDKNSATRNIKEASYEEIVELAYKGAKVIHPRAVEVAAEKNMPLRILGLISTGKSTWVKRIKSDKPVTGISSKNDIVYIKINPDQKNYYVSGIRIFQLFATAAISVDFIDIRADILSFLIDSQLERKALAILRDNNFDFEIRHNLCKVSVVGAGMTGEPGIMAKIVEALHSQNITILECSDSRTSISCLIDSKDEIKAIGALHTIFGLDEL